MTTDVLSDTDVSLKVVSNASGRMRVCVTGFNVDAVRAVAIEETVSQVTGVHAVHAYPRTASVVIWYSPELGDTAAVLSAITTAQQLATELDDEYVSTEHVMVGLATGDSDVAKLLTGPRR
ncbi:hypothetical protein GR254_22225 [Mycobacterium tuberculosis]|nr:hypothetical protein [Mycobacterium tuberculosis]